MVTQAGRQIVSDWMEHIFLTFGIDEAREILTEVFKRVGVGGHGGATVGEWGDTIRTVVAERYPEIDLPLAKPRYN